MRTDVIYYRLAEGITEEFLRSAAQSIYTEWMSLQPGFVSWEICSLGEGTFVDFVRWENAESAEGATKTMGQIDPAHDWFKCYDMASVKSENADRIVFHGA